MKISQREARRLKKRIAELERKVLNAINAFSPTMYDSTYLNTIELDVKISSAVCTAWKLNHAVVLKRSSGDNVFSLYAVKLPS